MDRYIAQQYVMLISIFADLKSNMDRFIECG